jgi:phosphoenolpyruvate synthase/pyruvate phosphate dikinase
MELIRKFNELGKDDAPIAGGKGASLGEMTHAGIPVPMGFVVLSAAFEAFIKETDLAQEIDTILHGVNPQEIHTVEAASEKIQGLIKNPVIPAAISDEINAHFKILNAEYVAVRSSATAEDNAEHAWAGQLDSYLNTKENNLLEKVQACWASLFTPRAIFYRFEKMLHETQISVAVVVQKMVASEASGIAFSVHPVTEDRNQLIIEAGFGLGEAIVSGQITPDSYVVEKIPRRIIDINVNKQGRALYCAPTGGNEWRNIPEPKSSARVLDEKQILELSELILRIENHYGFPCDIEWALDGGKFYIVQSRPITTLANRIDKISARKVVDFNKFTRCFQVSGTPFLQSEIYADFFKTHEALFVFLNDKWTSFVSNASIERMKLEGKELFLNSFPCYQQDFIRFIDRSSNDLETILAKNEIKKDDAENFINVLKEFFHYYEKTEFFFTDLVASFPKGFGELKNSSREYLNKLFFGKEALINKLLEKISETNAIDISCLKQYSCTELLDVFEGKLVQKTVIENRKRGYVMIAGEGKLEVIEWPKADIYEFSGDAVDTKELHGVTAFPGRVRGHAFTVEMSHGHYDYLATLFEKMQKGDVLVAETTSPEFMPGVHKAGAIVTNQGGLLSHAAIVARELRIPCIIDTKIGTQTIKSGDLIEVDADNGKVRIIKKTESGENSSGDYNPADYVRMFAGQHFFYNLTDVFLGYYKKLGVLCVQDERSWKSFMPKSTKEKTLREGLRLYTSDKLFKEYEKEFRSHMRTSVKFFSSVFAKDIISPEDVRKFFDFASAHFSYYSKTEFFYTDLLDQDKMIPTVKEFDKLKLDGRSHTNKMVFEGSGYIRSLFKKLSKQSGVDENDLLCYGIDEIIGRLEDGKKVDVAILKNRQTFFVSPTVSLFGGDAETLINKFMSAQRGISNVINGTVANKGKVRGLARVLDPEFKDFDKIAEAVEEMRDGEVLVAETTAPEIIKACKKASAIITNQGGMLSHAAIISRELGIPCIIGTDKDLILNIKTGDDIEVDGDNGIIRILNKK